MHDKYNKRSKNYLGRTLDSKGNTVEAFSVNDKIHLVYNLGKTSQYITSKSVDKISENIDDYLWTPYAYFVKGIINV